MRRLLILLTILPLGCSSEQAAAPPPQGPPRVTVAQPLKRVVVEWDSYTGRLDPVDFVEVRARVGGYLLANHFVEGQVVEKDSLLCVIDPRPFEAEVTRARAALAEAESRLAQSRAQKTQAFAQREQAQAQLHLAEVQLARAVTLFKTQKVSQDEVDVRESQVIQASADTVAALAEIEAATAAIAAAEAAVGTAGAVLKAAELDLSYTEIRAPITGLVSRRYITQGNLVDGANSGGTLLTTIVVQDPVHCYFDANERDLLKYIRLDASGERTSSRAAKNPIYLALVDEGGFPHKGHMDFVDNRVDPNTGTMRGRAIFPNPDGLLVPGLFARLRLPGSQPHEVVLIPDAALATDMGRPLVWVVDGEGIVQPQPVTLGPLRHGLRIVRTGLDGSERIVIRGLQVVRPGAPVQAEEGTIELELDPSLPDTYAPLPPEEWLRRSNG